MRSPNGYKVPQTCSECGAEFMVVPSRVGHWAYCGQECRANAAKKSKEARARDCEVCGEKLYPTRQQIQSGGGRYCSRTCYGRGLSIERKGEANPAWKGDGLGYFGIHNWLRREYGNPDQCEHCGANERIDWALKDGCAYERRRENFIGLCRGCHLRYDYANGTRSQRDT